MSSVATTTPKQFVFDYLSQVGTIPGSNEAEKLESDYLHAGLLDSFGIVELITTVENRFGIQLDSGDLEDPKFKTVGGLIATLEKKLNGAR